MFLTLGGQHGRPPKQSDTMRAPTTRNEADAGYPAMSSNSIPFVSCTAIRTKTYDKTANSE